MGGTGDYIVPKVFFEDLEVAYLKVVYVELSDGMLIVETLIPKNMEDTYE